MSEHQDEIDTLEGEIATASQRLHDIKARPMSHSEAQRLAKEDPDQFNSRWEAAQRAGRKPIVADRAA